MSVKHHVNLLQELSKLVNGILITKTRNKNVQIVKKFFQLAQLAKLQNRRRRFHPRWQLASSRYNSRAGKKVKTALETFHQDHPQATLYKWNGEELFKASHQIPAREGEVSGRKITLFCRNLAPRVRGLTSLLSSSPQTILFRLEIRGDRRQAAPDFGQFAARAGQWLLFIPHPRSFEFV